MLSSLAHKLLLHFYLLNTLWELPAVAADSTTDEIGSCLVDLRLSDILRLKKSVDILNERYDNYENRFTSRNNASDRKLPQATCAADCVQPTAMALVASERGSASSYADTSHHPWKVEEKPSKLQILFQISITALAFLSFGGYLLCLIVQAIKSKGTTYFHPVATATTATIRGGTKRIKIYRRSRRNLPYHQH